MAYGSMGVPSSTMRFYGLRRSLVREQLCLLAVLLLVLTTVARVSSLQLAGWYDERLVSAVAPPAFSRSLRVPSPAPQQHTAAPAPSHSSAGAPVAPKVPACTPDVSYRLPGPLDVSAAQPGVTAQLDPPHTYGIYGSDGTAVRQQIMACAPRLSGDAEFTAYTVYNLSWQYSYALSDTSCALANVKVGVHINQVFPAWHAAAATPAAFGSRWQTFMNNLASHEQGHVQLDEQYAAKLVSDLTRLTSADCTALAASAKAITSADVAALNTANDDYDASTNHGATQGAVLPD